MIAILVSVAWGGRILECTNHVMESTTEDCKVSSIIGRT